MCWHVRLHAVLFMPFSSTYARSWSFSWVVLERRTATSYILRSCCNCQHADSPSASFRVKLDPLTKLRTDFAMLHIGACFRISLNYQPKPWVLVANYLWWNMLTCQTARCFVHAIQFNICTRLSLRPNFLTCSASLRVGNLFRVCIYTGQL